MKQRYLWTLQIEVNKKITAYKENSQKLEILINILEEWMNEIRDNSIACLE